MKKILSFIKNYIKEIEQIKKDEFENERTRVINDLNSDWTEAQIRSYNFDLITSSAGWLGGDYDEYDCKLSLIRDNQNLFTIDEMAELVSKINHEKKDYQMKK